jgi:hypothetical protein
MTNVLPFRGKFLATAFFAILLLATTPNAFAQTSAWDGTTSNLLATPADARVGIGIPIVNFPPPTPFAKLAVQATGVNGNNGVIGQLQRGVFGDIRPFPISPGAADVNQWLAIGKSPIPATADAPYGMRLNWGGDLAIFQLRQQSSGEREGTIVWGNSRTTPFKFVFSSTNFSSDPPQSTEETVMTLLPPNPANRVVNGRVGINTTTPDVELRVIGTIRGDNVRASVGQFTTVEASSLKAEEFTVDKVANLPDYVFAADYKLMPLDELEKNIQTLKHLPNMPSAEEVAQNGMNLVDMQKRLLEKVEELTLYVIQLKKENDKLKAQMTSQAAPNTQP